MHRFRKPRSGADGPYRELLRSGRVWRVFLDELGEPAAHQFGLGILDLIGCPVNQTLGKATTWVRRVRNAEPTMAKRRALVELIETVVLSRLPALGRKELEQMLQLTDVRKSKVFAEGVEKGMEKVAARMLAKGKTVAEIADLTGLAAARIKRIKKKQS